MTDSPEEHTADLDDPQWVDKILARARERAAAAVDAPTTGAAPVPNAPNAPAAPAAPSAPDPIPVEGTPRPPIARRRPEQSPDAPEGAPRRPRPRADRTPDLAERAERSQPAAADRARDAAPTVDAARGPRPGGPRPASTVLTSEGSAAADAPRWGAAAASSGRAPAGDATMRPAVAAADARPDTIVEPARRAAPALDDARDDVPGGPDESADEVTDAEDADDGGRRRFRNGVEWVAVAVGAVVVALVIRAFVLQAFYIPSESMVPTLKENDRILVNKLSYRLHDVNRGDLVVFHKPPNEPPGEASDLIKRVIGLSGETLELRGNDIYIDGRRLTEPYLTGDVVTSNLGWVAGCTNAQTERTQCTVPPGHVFVMGDNRTRSHDSRFFGPISEELIVGRAFVRVWPLGDLGFL